MSTQSERVLRCAELELQLTKEEIDAVVARCQLVDLRGGVDASDFIREAEKVLRERA